MAETMRRTFLFILLTLVCILSQIPNAIARTESVNPECYVLTDLTQAPPFIVLYLYHPSNTYFKTFFPTSMAGRFVEYGDTLLLFPTVETDFMDGASFDNEALPYNVSVFVRNEEGNLTRYSAYYLVYELLQDSAISSLPQEEIDRILIKELINDEYRIRSEWKRLITAECD